MTRMVHKVSRAATAPGVLAAPSRNVSHDSNDSYDSDDLHDSDGSSGSNTSKSFLEDHVDKPNGCINYRYRYRTKKQNG